MVYQYLGKVSANKERSLHNVCSYWQQINSLAPGRFELEQRERLRSEIPPAAPWLPILVIHIRSQVKTTQSQSYKFLKTAKISNFARNFARDTPSEVAL